jgi:ApaG protein
VAIKFKHLPGLNVKVDRVEYNPGLSAPPDKPFGFAYYLSIHNDSSQTVTLFGRKWVVRDHDDGSTLVVEGDGIVGQFPRLEPGNAFSYNSYHVILNGSTAQGAFFGTTEEGVPVRTIIPDFRMEPPMFA